MAYTLAELVAQACGEMGLTQPSAVIGSTNNQTMQLRALVQRLGKDLIREYEWQRAVKIGIFQGTDSVVTTGDTTDDSTSVTDIPDTSSISAGYIVSGAGIMDNTEVSVVNSSTAVTLTMPATATGGDTALTFKKQDYALASDYDRFVADTHWDRTNQWSLYGPKSSQEWQWITSGMIATGPYSRFRLFGNNIRITPAPTASTQVFAYEYVSTFWVIATGGTAATKATATVDTDLFIFPDDLMLAGLKYYFLKAKKLDWGVEFAEFRDILSARKAQDQPTGALSLTPTPVSLLSANVPDGNWTDLT